jgi:molybdopterin/thiamine biosynthesis adenylyltransferase
MEKKIDPNVFIKGKRRKPTVCYPDGMPNANATLWGYYFEESNYYNIVGVNKIPEGIGGVKPICLGHFYEFKPEKNSDDLIVGYYENDKIKFTDVTHTECELEPVRLKMDIFSRNTGILESDIMLKKGAIILGCGSVGSLVALELARAGVVRFFLIDMDILGYHNICRHQCGIQDVGKFKTTAIKERILQINPTAQVFTEHKKIQEVPFDIITPFCNSDTIIVGCADNREGDLYADTMLAKPYKMPFISIGCWERAFAGEIFYCLPEGMPAYSDFMAALGESSGRVNANTHLYMGEVGSFEPGISVDINFVTTIAVKMILDLINRDNEHYTQRLINTLSQYTLICNTNNPKIGGEMAEIFSYPLQVTTSIEIEYAQNVG